MKKVLSLALALTLVFAMAIPAMALDATTTNGDVEVSTTVAVAYTVTIPMNATITPGTASTDIGDLALTGAVLAPDKEITVTVTGGELTDAGAGKLAHSMSATTKLPFTLKIDGAATNSTSFTANGTKPVNIDIASTAWSAAPAGDYSATLTFVVNYTDTP